MIKKLIGSVLAFFFFCIALNSEQPFKQFSGKPELFKKEISDFITVRDNDIEILLKEFNLNWDSARFSTDQKEKIIELSKCLIDKKARPVPEFTSFLKTLNAFISAKHPASSFNEWLSALQDLCANKKSTLSSFTRTFNQAYGLLVDNILYESPSLKWKPSSHDFHFQFDKTLKIIFDNTNLVCYAKHDSIVIYNTKGYDLPFSSLWIGEGALVTWERAGYDRNVIKASLSKYKIDLTKTSYEADSVKFMNKTYFGYELLGHLNDDVTYIKSPSSALYPKFDSYQKEFEIKNLYENVDYKGGFSMQGAKLLGKGSLDETAKLSFYRKDTLKLKVSSLYFVFRPEKVISPDAAIRIFLDKDSISHGDVQFTYTTNNKEISVLKSENFTSQSPFLDSYHMLNLNFEQLKWRIDEPEIIITTTPGSAIGKATFESVNFFNQNEFEKLQFYDAINPLSVLRKFSDKEKSRNFPAQDFADYIHRNLDQVHVLLFPLALKGYILYDVATEQIQLNEMLFDNLKASIGRIDYDVIRLNSTTNAPLENGTIDLRNDDLKINGIQRIFVSDSQNVVIYPKDQSIIMKRNRSFQFDGVTEAGLFTFFGRNFFFNYDSFKVVLKDVDSVRIKVIVGRDNYNKPILQDVHNVLNNVTGQVEIDHPNNKSGLKNNPEYPKFTSYGNSYVYYDASNIYKGVYDRKKDFYFKIYPYEFDSINNFSKQAMKFKGEFSSAKIFPLINEQLVLREDFSLGFKHDSPKEGYPVYGGKGTFISSVQLSNLGLIGDGTIKYITSSSNSKDIKFFPDSMNTIAPDFTINPVAAGTQFPQVNGNDVNIHWMPYLETMKIKNEKGPFKMFNGQATLAGALNLKPKGLSGNGTIDMKSALAVSKNYTFGLNTIDADTTNFKLRSLHNDGFAVATDNVKSHIDFTNRIGKFKSNNDTTTTVFPENRYIAQLDEFKWKMDAKTLEMISNRQQEASKEGLKYGFKDEPLAGSRYTSIKYDQDSLSFVSPLAIYDYDSDKLNVQKVKYIEVADARLFPDKGNIIIEKDAKMLPLENAKILANTSTRFHNFYKALAYIQSKHKYTGKGLYDYKDENNKVETLNFTEIAVDTSGQTFGNATVVEPDDFTLNPEFQFQGKAELFAAQKNLTFDGSVHITEDCHNYGTSWLRFDTIIDPLNVAIPVTNKLVEINRRSIVLGTLITTDSIHVYSSFFGTRKYYSDSLISTATGNLRYIKDSSIYLVASDAKFKKISLPLPMVYLDTKQCKHHDEGQIKFGVDLGQLKLKAFGKIDEDLEKNEIYLRCSMSIEFMMLDKSMQFMAKTIDSIAANGSKVDIKSKYFLRNYGYWLDSAKFSNFYDTIPKTEKDLPEEFSTNLFISDVKFIWDDVENSYRSVGKIGIGYIAKKQINKYVDGYIEIYRRRSGNKMDIYLQVDDNTFYYFGYTRSTMQVLSSDQPGFNQPIHDMKDADRSMKVERNQIPYTFLISTSRKMELLKKRWKAFQLNGVQKVQEQIKPEEQKEEGDDKKLDNEENTNPQK
jgi:hypothetical protein